MGKSMVIYIIGMSIVIAYAVLNLNKASLSAADAFHTYYAKTMAHNIAVTGANIGTQLCLNDTTYSASVIGQAFSGGTFDMTVTKSGDTARIRSTSWFPLYYYDYHKGQWANEVRDTVEALLKRTVFSKYGWFTDAETNGYAGGPYFGYDDWKITGDSVFGPAHTNGHFNLGGGPYFNDKITATNAPQLWSYDGQNPVFNGGYEWGITVPRPTANMTQLQTFATSTGGLINNAGNDVAMTFMNDGRVAVTIPPVTGTMRRDTVALTALAPQGVVAVSGGDIRITGTYHGQATVAALKGGTTNKGNVWIDGNGIVASNDPQINQNSNDILGIVAEKSTYITQDNTRTSSSLVKIQAAVYCHEGELTAQNFWLIGLSGRVSLFGGVTQKTAGSLGVFGSSGITNGFDYSIRYDNRFRSVAPPGYPKSTKYELVSWWEN